MERVKNRLFFSSSRQRVLSVCPLNQSSSKDAGEKMDQECPDLDALPLEP